MDAEKHRAAAEGETALGATSWPGADRPQASAPTEGAAVGAAVDAGRCKYPGCRGVRQPRSNRRGAPPAYCADPTHEPDAARRERARRRRLGLELDVALDEYDRPLPEPDAHDALDQDVLWALLPQPRGPTDTPLPSVHPGRDASAAFGSATAADLPGGIEPGAAAALARRLADQLALAATAYEQLAEQIAVTAAENAELRERLQTMHNDGHSRTDSKADSGTDSGPESAPDPASE